MEQLAERIIKNKHNIKDSFYWLYPFTNENIDGYFSRIDFKDKDVLTVTSSGDHIFNAMVYGANNIDSFDINPLARYYVELKVAAIKSLTREEFISFFYNNSKLIPSKLYFNKNLYKKIQKNLFGVVREFWDKLFELFEPKQICRSKLFTDDFTVLDGLLEANIYMREKYYNYLKRIINGKKIKYYNIDIKSIDSIGKKYDIVVLSNIAARLDEVYKDDNSHIGDLKSILDKITNDNSLVVLNYNYANMLITSPDDYQSLPRIYDLDEVKKYFPDVSKISFSSSHIYTYPKIFRKYMDYKDTVLVQKKKLIQK